MKCGFTIYTSINNSTVQSFFQPFKSFKGKGTFSNIGNVGSIVQFYKYNYPHELGFSTNFYPNHTKSFSHNQFVHVFCCTYTEWTTWQVTLSIVKHFSPRNIWHWIERVLPGVQPYSITLSQCQPKNYTRIILLHTVTLMYLV